MLNNLNRCIMKNKKDNPFQKNKELKDELLKRVLYVNPITRGSEEAIEYLIVSNLEPLPIGHTQGYLSALEALFFQFNGSRLGELSIPPLETGLKWSISHPELDDLLPYSIHCMKAPHLSLRQTSLEKPTISLPFSQTCFFTSSENNPPLTVVPFPRAMTFDFNC